MDTLSQEATVKIILSPEKRSILKGKYLLLWGVAP